MLRRRLALAGPRWFTRACSSLCLMGALCFCLAACGGTHRGGQHHGWLVLSDPINAAQELGMPFGSHSQWLQPWRAYLDTPPASDVIDDLGINFNVNKRDADATAAALEQAGFHHARVEIGWETIDPGDPNQLDPKAAAGFRIILSALFRHHLRPLILLNANSQKPTPTQRVTLELTKQAPAGSTRVTLSRASIAGVVPRRTGFNLPNRGGVVARPLISGVKGTVATLSRPLTLTLPPGTYVGTTLAYQPFTDPREHGFTTTMDGWLSYVHAVASFVRSVGGGNGFDVEVWNELGFGSQFLSINNYYTPPINPYAKPQGFDSATEEAILTSTAKLIHRDFPGVLVGDGFSDTRPYASGLSVPAGVEIDKHYYNSRAVYPAANQDNGVRPVDWLGRPFGTRTATPRGIKWTPYWVPSYTSDFPEYWLSGIPTETLIRDLTPLSGEKIGGLAHGRSTHRPGSPPPSVWMTEYGLAPPRTFTPTQAARFHAKAVLRYLLAFINKGLGQVDFYAAQGGGLGLLPKSFYTSINRRTGVASASPGLTMTVLARLKRYMYSDPGMRRRSVSLLQISTTDNRDVFAGNGKYPPLRNLDVAAFFPFQQATDRFVFAAYVMTRDLGRPWQKAGPDEYDMPPAPYRFVVGGVDGCHTQLSAYDPLAGRSVAVRRIACTAHTLTLQTELTDSPILIEANGA